MLPDALESVFHQAFTERGASGARPSAHQWVAALDGLRERLTKCGTSGMHVYPNHLEACPWCALESQGVVYFVDLGTTSTPTYGGFVVTQVWGLIQAAPPPPRVSLPSPSSFNVTPRPLPAGVPGGGTITFFRLVAVAIAVGIIVAAPGAWFIALLVGWAGWAMASNAGSSERTAERTTRHSAMVAARQEYDQLVERAKKEAGPEGFHGRRADLAKLKDELESLPRAETDELDKLHATAHDRQKQKFLDTCFIDHASISGVGPARKAALRSFGIETAADVSKSRVMQVHGFGESLTRAVLDWKASCERRFRFNQAAAVSEADRNAVRTKYATRRVAIERTLAAAPEQLNQFRQQSATKLSSLKPQIEAAARTFAQAQADYSLLG